MDELKQFLKNKPFLAIAAPTILCFVSLVTNIIASIQDGLVSGTDLHEISSSANGFESVILILMMYAAKTINKK